MSITSLIVFCYLPESIEAVPAGKFDYDTQSGIGSFQYGHRYLERHNALAVDCAALPLGGPFLPATSNGGLYGAFRDASPDYWGRLVIASRLHCPIEAITEIDYLQEANATRVGNLDFRFSPEDPEPTFSPPQFQDIDNLLKASEELEQGHPVDEQIRVLLEQGSSLGGARPKCTLEMDDELWLAKFPSRNDGINIPRVEYATMTLARECGLIVPELRLLTIGTRDALLVRRFDRTSISGSWSRLGFMSALSLAEWDERDRERWSYRTIADRIRRHSKQPDTDLHELFSRIAFNILVRNTDDHPRNHGFLMEQDGLSLSPLYDVVPALTRSGVGTEFSLAMGIGPQGRLAKLSNLCSVAPVFNLTSAQAKNLTTAMQKRIAQSWQETFLAAGLTEADIVLLEPSMTLPFAKI
ncbi:MAG: type II toxin-antitoxin system HipA family toxin [Spartobacteria bacterium]|nr:type II toxin-antitoxin system HipA family toxin [Spartobacteria bacterium]